MVTADPGFVGAAQQLFYGRERPSTRSRGRPRGERCGSHDRKRDPEVQFEGKLGSGDILNKTTHLVAPNITPDSETGAGRWTDDQLVRAIRQGVSHDGRRLSVVMPYPTLSRLTDEDVHAIVAYLRSLPPVKNAPPTHCPRCGRRHGLGELNSR